MSCCASCSDLQKSKVFLDKDFKTAISMRDGYQVYHGSEIGLRDNRSYKLFRSAEEILSIFKKLKNIPVTIDHVDPSKPIESDRIVGRVKSSKIIDSNGDSDSQVAVENILDLDEEAMTAIKDGKKELSLGYMCETRDHDTYDLEQFNIKPHHLAIVQAGRCGDICSITDQQKRRERPMRLDAFVDGLEEIITEFRDGAEKEEKKKPAFLAKDDDDEEEEMTKDEAEEKKEKKMAKKMDSSFDRRLIDAEVKRSLKIIDKASNFLPSSYPFADKANDEIMIDSIRAVHPDMRLNRNEIEIAFKMLSDKQSKHTTFGDSYMEPVKGGVMDLAGQSILGDM